MSNKQSISTFLGIAAGLVLVFAAASTALAQPGTVLSHQKISATEGGFTGTLDDLVQFGTSVASLGDLDGDGVGDLAVGAIGDDDGGANRGAVWILFLNADGTVQAHQKISDTEGGFAGILDNADIFGTAVASLGDLDGDGVGDLGVGAMLDDDGGTDRGAVWILFLNADGTVQAHQKISDTEGGFTGILDHEDWFGFSVASMGDLNGDGLGDLAVGVPFDDDGGTDRGAVWILFLNADGTVQAHQKISDTEGGFTGTLDNFDDFGWSVVSLGDLDDDGVGDLAVGATADDDGGEARGAVWILFLNPDGTVKSHQKISDTEGGFTGTLDDLDHFGTSVASLGDLDADGVTDLAVGAHGVNDGGTDAGAVWVLFLKPDGTVNSHQKIRSGGGGFTGTLGPFDEFGWSAASLGDLDGDGVGDLAVGAIGDDDGGGNNRGAVWVLFLDGVLSCPEDVVYVDDDGPLGGNGLGWKTAYRFLRDALADAAACQGMVSEIRVAQGVYKPDRDEATPDGTGDREATFQLVDGVALRGGFLGLSAGKGEDRDQRNIQLFETILSGDLLGNDGPDFANNEENSYHVVRAINLSNTTILDGLSITRGNANGTSLDQSRGGGGWFDDNNQFGDLVITMCDFRLNYASGEGAGAFAEEGRPRFIDCTFSGNVAENHGGGISTRWNTPVLSGCVFESNSSTIGKGGGAYIHKARADMTVTDCTFSGNVAGLDGGGLYYSFPSLTNLNFTVRGSIFRNNVAPQDPFGFGDGGGLYADDAKIDLIDCEFIGNTCFKNGGGAYLDPNNPFGPEAGSVVNCDFRGNQATLLSGGGLYFPIGEEYLILNCQFVGNSAGDRGGGMCSCASGGGPGRTIVNCTFALNAADGSGGGLLAADTDDVIVNSVFSGNSDSSGSGESAQVSVAAIGVINYSCVEGWSGALGGIGNIGADPMFVDVDGPDDVPGTDDDDLRLLPGSPCIDAGDNTVLPTDEFDLDGDGDVDELLPFDLDGNPRFVDDPGTPDTGNGDPPIVDMGAYEFQFQDVDGDGIPDDEDACPDSDLAKTIVIDGCDTGVGNMLFDDGCTMADLIAECAEGASNHGDFVSCVAHLTNEWKHAGLITGKDKGAIQRCAAQSTVPGGLSLVSSRGVAGGGDLCPTDINGDGVLNVLDLIDLLLCFGQPALPGCEPQDINNDGSVNVLDLIELLLAFGTACP